MKEESEAPAAGQFDADPPLGSHAADLKELRVVQAENDRLRAELATRVCPGSGWPSTTTMSNSAGVGACGICCRMVLVGPLNQCHTHAALGGWSREASNASAPSGAPEAISERGASLKGK